MDETARRILKTIIYKHACNMIHVCMYSNRKRLPDGVLQTTRLSAIGRHVCVGSGVPCRASYDFEFRRRGIKPRRQLPASGRTGQAGSVEAQQSASPGSGVATVNSSIQVSGNYAGSVPASNVPGGSVTLRLADALKLGMKANLASISAGNSVQASRAERIQALSALLPNISANASETVTQVNLAAYGFQFKLPPGLNFSIPSVVGPFSYSQLQGSLSQSVYDPVQRRNWKASKESERASILSAKDAQRANRSGGGWNLSSDFGGGCTRGIATCPGEQCTSRLQPGSSSKNGRNKFQN